MLPEIGASELLVIAIVALIVIGPKDLPVMLRKLGQFMAKLRGMASEFRASFDEMARQSELDDLRKEVEAMRKGQIADIAARASGAEMSQALDEISQSLTDAGVQLHPPMSWQYEPQAEEAAGSAALEAPKPARTRKAPAKRAAPSKKTTPAKTPAPAKRAAGAKSAPAKPAAKTPAAAPRKPRAKKTGGDAR